MNLSELVQGENIELLVKVEGKEFNFRSEVYEIMGEALLVLPITMDGKTMGFSNKYQISMIYTQGEKPQIWDSVTVQLVNKKGTILHKITSEDIESRVLNRREAFRVFVGEEGEIYISSGARYTTHPVLIKDISETGIGFISSEDFDLSQKFHVEFPCGHTVIELVGVIVRKVYIDEKGSYLYGGNFVKTHQSLRSYIFQKQKKNRDSMESNTRI